jgi:hypothetical protein
LYRHLHARVVSRSRGFGCRRARWQEAVAITVAITVAFARLLGGVC